MNSITSKELHERTGSVLDKVRSGQRFQVVRDGKPAAFLVPTDDQIDPSWNEIMADVRTARSEAQAKGDKPVKNLVLEERRKREALLEA